MSRTHRNKSIVFNNYVVIPFVARVAAGNSASNLEVALLPMPARFRVSHLQMVSLGETAVLQGGFKINTLNVNLHPSLLTLTGGTPVEVTTENLNQIGRDVPKGDSLRMRVDTDSGGDSVAGGVAGYVTGYFQDPINKTARFMESGQSAGQRPQAGFYCNIPMYNLRANANKAEQVDGSVIAPWDCRIMAIGYHILGHDESTGTITAQLRNETQSADVHVALDIDTNEEYILDANSGTAFASSAVRDVSRGDVIDLRLATGVADIIPIGTASADVLVWVQGHANVDPNTED